MSLRWWHGAVIVICALLTVFTLITDAAAWRLIGALTALGAFLIGWFTVGRLAWRSRAAAITYGAIVIITVGVATGFHSAFVMVQLVAYPLLWKMSRSTRNGLLSTLALAVAVAVGLWFFYRSIPPPLIIATLSYGANLGFGLWITHIETGSKKRQHLLDKQLASQDSLAAMSRDSGIEHERARIAREIHDTIAQDLTGLVLLAQKARRDIANGRGNDAITQLELIESSARTTLAETRGLIAASAPVELNDGLEAALNRLATRFTREAGVTVTVTGSADGTPRNNEVVLLRCAQEALSNVRKHARARTASLALSANDDSIRLVVSDDGHGFDPEHRKAGFGLDGMRDRLALVGGALTVTSSTAGTVITADLPREQR